MFIMGIFSFGFFVNFVLSETPAKRCRQPRNTESANAEPHYGCDKFMLKSFFCRNAFVQIFIAPPTLFPASADIIFPVVFDAANFVITIGKHRTAIGFKGCGNGNFRRVFRVFLSKRAD